MLLTDWINQVGDPSVIHGFCSDGCHNVEHTRFKDFDQHRDAVPKVNLADMTGQLSARMGAAIHHAGHHLKLRRSAKKRLIVITDGEPADIDIRDPHYLRYDTKKAVEGVAKIWRHDLLHEPRSARRQLRVAHLRAEELHGGRSRAALPEKLPLLYARLIR